MHISGRPATKKDEEAFAVITKSAELLTDPVTRRHYDSIDPKNDDSLPKVIILYYEYFILKFILGKSKNAQRKLLFYFRRIL